MKNKSKPIPEGFSTLTPHLVVKGDYQWFQVNQGFRRFDLGLGVSF